MERNCLIFNWYIFQIVAFKYNVDKAAWKLFPAQKLFGTRDQDVRSIRRCRMEVASEKSVRFYHPRVSDTLRDMSSARV